MPDSRAKHLITASSILPGFTRAMLSLSRENESLCRLQSRGTDRWQKLRGLGDRRIGVHRLGRSVVNGAALLVSS